MQTLLTRKVSIKLLTRTFPTLMVREYASSHYADRQGAFRVSRKVVPNVPQQNHRAFPIIMVRENASNHHGDCPRASHASGQVVPNSPQQNPRAIPTIIVRENTSSHHGDCTGASCALGQVVPNAPQQNPQTFPTIIVRENASSHHGDSPGASRSSRQVVPNALQQNPPNQRRGCCLISVREPAAPFVSMAEMMKKFQSSTRDMPLPHVRGSLSRVKSKLTLTRPKEPELETAKRVRSCSVKSIADHNVESSSNNQWKPNLAEPKTPTLHTLMRARSPKVRSSLEIEKAELEKIPKFKPRPVNKKLSLNSETCNEKPLPRNTTPEPFHLHTEERGMEKEKKFRTGIMQKQQEEERARVPKANPYPHTTNYRVVPPKPEPKQCTQPEPFQLESPVRHQEELKRENEESPRKEHEAAQMRIFRAQPILKEDPYPIPEKVQRPVTQVQQITLHVVHRAVDRAKFDQKMEEEKALRQLSRTLVPRARRVLKFDNPFVCHDGTFQRKENYKSKVAKLRVLQRKENSRMLINAGSFKCYC